MDRRTDRFGVGTANSRAGFSGRGSGIGLFLLLLAALPAVAQYTGKVQKGDQKKPPPPRAVAVLEWVGDPGKPVASRIVPVAVFVDGQYQDGGLYLAQPAPLAVESDTRYELEQAGVPKGMFDVFGGQNVGGVWFGYGQWKPLGAPKPVKKLQASKVPPRVVQDADADRPRFKGGDAPAGSTVGSGTTSTPAASTSSTPATDDPDKPTLHRRDASGTGSDGTDSAGAGTAPEDPDRPHMKKRSDTAAIPSGGGENGSPVSSVNEADPDRPKMSRGAPVAPQKQLEAGKLSSLPPDLQQMAAVSDPAVREEHGFAYPWPEPDDAVKMQTAVELLAIKAVLGVGAASPNAKAPTAPARPRTLGAPRNTLAHQVPLRALPVVLSEKNFRAYELAYNAGATVVLTAKALVGPNGAGVTLEKYVTIIAQPDFDGVPQIRLQSVTDIKDLDVTPRMRLVDAVDTQGVGRADLVFELRRATDRQFAIYRVRGDHAEQSFATESLPYGAPNHLETTDN